MYVCVYVYIIYIYNIQYYNNIYIYIYVYNKRFFENSAAKYDENVPFLFFILKLSPETTKSCTFFF